MALIDDIASKYATSPGVGQSEEEKESTFQEIGEGIVSGLIGIPQGIAELGASAVDLVADTDYARDVTDFFEGVRAAGGIDPEGAAGEIAEVITQFAVPGLTAASLVSKARILANAPKFVRGAAQAGAAGVTDAVVTTEGTTTIGDFFEGGPTQTTDLIGLEGREAALARMGNKLKFGLEAAGATALIEPTLKAIGQAGRFATTAATPVAAPVARAALDAGTALSTTASELISKTPFVGNLLTAERVEDIASVFRFRGNLPQDVAEVRSTIRGKVEAEATAAYTTLSQLRKNLDQAYKGVEEVMVAQTPMTRADLNNNLYGFLTGEVGEEVLPDFVKAQAKQMREQVDGLSRKIEQSDFLQGKEEVLSQIKNNIGSYLRRKYKLFEDEGFQKTDEFRQARADTVELFKKNPKVYEKFYKRVYGAGKKAEDDLPVIVPEEDFIGVGKSMRVKESAAEDLVAKFLATANQKRKAYVPKSGTVTSRTAIDKLKTDMFKARTVNNQTIRRLLGEVRDPEEAFVSTVADMAEFTATDDFLSYLARQADRPGEGILSKEAFEQLPPELQASYNVLKEDYWGMAQGMAVSNRVHRDLTRVVSGDLGIMANTARTLYSGFLRGKGATQFSKTVLSPITQVRNVTSASLFALAQGNVGRGANLFESFSTVFDNITKRGDKVTYYTKLQRLGVIGNQAQIREIDRLMQEGLGVTREADEVVAGVRVGKQGGNMFTRSKGGAFLQKGTGLARELYQGGDDVWKIYNFEFERSKITSAFGTEKQAAKAIRASNPERYRGMASEQVLDDYAADIVKNTVPNYERVPEFIKGIRKLPVGNFIAFPAEIIRTSGNTLKQALTELASESPELQRIGMRRLTGLTFTTMAAPVAIQQTAMMLTGVDEDQLNAVRRSGPEWSRNSRLIPTSVDDDGNLTGYMDFSYTNPYDYLQRPIQGIFNAVVDGQDLGKDPGKIAFNATIEAVKEIFEPFAGESIITEKIIDTTLRGGQTRTGAKVFRDVDETGTKAYKSFVHILDAFNPGMSPVDLKAQAKTTQMPGVQMGRFMRGMVSSEADPAGNERFAATEFLRAVTGLSEIEVKPDNIVMYSSFDYSGNITGARQIFNTAVKTRGVLTDAEALNVYRDANESLFRVQNKMYQTVQDMRALGMRDSEIRRALKKYKIGNVNELMRGRFVPMAVSQETRREVRTNGNRLPMSEIRGIAREFRGRRLGATEQPTEVQEAPTSDVSSIVQGLLTSSAPSAPNTGALSPSAAAPPSAAVAPVPTTTTPQTRLALAGLNPATQAIAARNP